MLARIRKAQENNEGGFTLIELLVVMIIIGILAAIAIPAFLNQKNKAKATSAKADVSTIGKEIAAYFVDNPTPSAAITVTTVSPNWSFNATPAITGRLSSGNKAAGSVTSESNWCVAVWNTEVDTTDPAAGAAGNGSVWKYQASTGLSKGNCP